MICYSAINNSINKCKIYILIMVKIMFYYLNIFFLISILGHIIENIVYVHVDSGILYGYWTPIYGIGSLIILLINYLLDKLKINKKLKPFFLFLISALSLCLLEFIGGYLIEILFGRIFWNYEDQALNIGKYTSVTMGLIWGLASLLLIYIVMPILNKIIKKIPKWITIILVILFVIDIVFTFINIGN